MTDAPEPFRPEATGAFDRIQTRSGAHTGAHADDQRFPWIPVGIVVLVVVGLAIAWALLRRGATATNENLLAHLIEAADTFQPDVVTTNPDEAEGYIFDALGWVVPPPDLPGLAIVGVGVATIGEAPTGAPNTTPTEVVVPAYRFEGASGESAYVFVYDYPLLDQVRHAFDLPEVTYSILSEPTPVDTRVTDGTYLVTWRVRSMIFTAVTESEAVFERVGQSVSS